MTNIIKIKMTLYTKFRSNCYISFTFGFTAIASNIIKVFAERIMKKGTFRRAMKYIFYWLTKLNISIFEKCLLFFKVRIYYQSLLYILEAGRAALAVANFLSWWLSFVHCRKSRETKNSVSHFAKVFMMQFHVDLFAL